MITITIKTDNSAFANGNEEVARILRKLADKIDDGCLIMKDEFSLLDINGNNVGKYVCTKNREVIF